MIPPEASQRNWLRIFIAKVHIVVSHRRVQVLADKSFWQRLWVRSTLAIDEETHLRCKLHSELQRLAANMQCLARKYKLPC